MGDVDGPLKGPLHPNTTTDNLTSWVFLASSFYRKKKAMAPKEPCTKGPASLVPLLLVGIFLPGKSRTVTGGPEESATKEGAPAERLTGQAGHRQERLG